MTTPVVPPVVPPVPPVVTPVVSPSKPPFDIGAFTQLVLNLQKAMKKGYTTSEFALSAIGVLSSILLQLFGKDWGLHAHAKDISTLVLVLVPVGYALARAWTKSAHSKVVVAALNAQTSLLPALVAVEHPALGLSAPPLSPPTLL